MKILIRKLNNFSYQYRDIFTNVKKYNHNTNLSTYKNDEKKYKHLTANIKNMFTILINYNVIKSNICEDFKIIFNDEKFDNEEKISKLETACTTLITFFDAENFYSFIKLRNIEKKILDNVKMQELKNYQKFEYINTENFKINYQKFELKLKTHFKEFIDILNEKLDLEKDLSSIQKIIKIKKKYLMLNIS